MVPRARPGRPGGPPVRGAVRRAGAARRARPRPGRRAGGAVRRRADRVAGLGVRGAGDGPAHRRRPGARHHGRAGHPRRPGRRLRRPRGRRQGRQGRHAHREPSRDLPRAAPGGQRRPGGGHPPGDPHGRGRPRRRPAADRRGRDQRGRHLEQPPRLVLDRHLVRSAAHRRGRHRAPVVAPRRRLLRRPADRALRRGRRRRLVPGAARPPPRPGPGHVLCLARAGRADPRHPRAASSPTATPATWQARSATPRCRRRTPWSSSSGARRRSWPRRRTPCR